MSKKINSEEILIQTNKQFKNLKTISYNIKYEFKQDKRLFNLDEDIDLKYAPNDSLKMFHNFICYTYDSHQVYNGENMVALSNKKKTAYLSNPKICGNGNITGNYTKPLIRKEFFEKNYFKDLIDWSTSLNNTVEFSEFNGEQVYKVELKEKELKNKKGTEKITYYFRTSDYFPIGYDCINKYKETDDLVYSKYVISNISKNRNFRDNNFNPEFYLTSRYKVENCEPLNSEIKLKVGNIAPLFNGETTKGENIKLLNYKGKIVILDFWFNSCIPCLKALPYLQKISDNYSKDVIVLGVNPYNDKEDVLRLFKNKNISYPSLFLSKAIAEQYSILDYPSLFILNKKGEITFIHSGWSEDSYSEILKEIKSLW